MVYAFDRMPVTMKAQVRTLVTDMLDLWWIKRH
jgi:hypothetical protein